LWYVCVISQVAVACCNSPNLKEVFYNDDGTLMGFADACIGGDTLDEARHVFNKYIFEGVGKPALHEDDFKNASFNGEDE
jgi:hypothetical protein